MAEVINVYSSPVRSPPPTITTTTTTKPATKSTSVTAPASSSMPTASKRPESASKKPRFRLNCQIDLLLCKAVSEAGAHAPPVNEKAKLMQEACEILIGALLQQTLATYAERKGKTMNDRIELLVANRRNE